MTGGNPPEVGRDPAVGTLLRMHLVIETNLRKVCKPSGTENSEPEVLLLTRFGESGLLCREKGRRIAGEKSG